MATRLGKETVVVKDRQGFVTSRAVIALVTECMRMLEEGVASAEDIDKAIRLGLNHPMGPLELADYVGLDTLVLAGEGLTEAFGERFNPHRSRCASWSRPATWAARQGRASIAMSHDR